MSNFLFVFVEEVNMSLHVLHVYSIWIQRERKSQTCLYFFIFIFYKLIFKKKTLLAYLVPYWFFLKVLQLWDKNLSEFIIKSILTIKSDLLF